MLSTLGNQVKYRYQEYSGNFKDELYNGQGRLILYSDTKKQVVLDFYDGYFAEGLKKGVGKQVKLKEEAQEGRLEREYEEYVGEFFRDKPYLSNGGGKSKIIKNFHA